MTSSFAARLSCESPDWYTPIRYVDAARAVMGGIDLDPASEPAANTRIQAARFYTAEENGLERPWFGKVFVNPPGKQTNAFWSKLLREWHSGVIEQAVWIGFSLQQLQTLQHAAAQAGQQARPLFDLPAMGHETPLNFPLCIPRKRIEFVENAAKRGERLAQGKPEPDSPTHANYVTYLGPHVQAFVDVFQQFGQVQMHRSE
jgi:hypothetical protein